ncbi:MAG: Holliday junction helicase RuvA [Myxococcaceae bacterium]|nr:Holliday junction helicase RuvA [Myxococcaceae bacterium]
MSESPDGLVVVDVAGVGYEVLLPLGTLGRCTADAEGRVTLQVVTHVREDAITLFGFANDRERAAFRLLTAVAGVGPRIAISVLGVLPAGELAHALARGDVKKITSVPGVGKRIAERLVLELKDKLTGLAAGGDAMISVGAYTAPASPIAAVGPAASLVAALVNMGFKAPEAERAAAELAPRMAEPLDVLVRESLRRLVR